MRLLLILALLIPFQLLSQVKGGTTNKTAQKHYIQAGRLISDRDYAQALNELGKAVQIDPRFIAAFQQMGDLNRRLGNFENALKNYKSVLALDPEFHSLSYYGLAESEFNTGDYQNSLSHFRKYAEMPGVNPENRKKAEKYIRDAIFSLAAIQQPADFKPINLGSGINSENDEYLPAITADEENIIFTRLTNNSEDFFQSRKVDGNWNEAKSLGTHINTPGNEGAQCISPDGNYLFFTACDRPDGLGRCDIYISKREDGEWSEPFNIGAPINTNGWESQPSISADGRTLYFVSTRSGGEGGYDIWKSDLIQDGSWTQPQNLGPDVNTPFDEHSPFIHPDGKSLYFSSNGWPGLGNKDLFISRKLQSDTKGAVWGTPVNLGYPINTFREESSLSISATGKVALMASKRDEGMGGLDIYSFELPDGLKPAPVSYVKGRVFDRMTGSPIPALVKITDLETGKLVFDDLATADSGHFLATMTAGGSFALNISQPGYLFYSMNFQPDLKTYEQPFKIEAALERIEVGRLAVLRNIFFEVNRYELLPESKSELDILVRFLEENPSVSIEIAGHTDSEGEDQFNEELSEKRAITVYNYLIDNNISSSRLIYKGYGEKSPISSNDTEEGRASNRRTEFKITKK